MSKADSEKRADFMQKVMIKVILLIGFSLILGGSLFTAKIGSKLTNTGIEVQECGPQNEEAKNSEHISRALDSCQSDGAEAAGYLNKIKDQDDFEMGVRKVLDQYYTMEKSKRQELKSFVETVNDSAAVIAANYEEAARERENSADLDYQAEEVMVSFSHSTSKAEIEKIVEEAADSYEIVDSGEVCIDENLPNYKKKRLEKIKDYKTDIVILAKINLEDTVKRAEEKFRSYDCVKDVSRNYFLEADGVIGASSGIVKSNDPFLNGYDQWNMENINIPAARKKFKKVKKVTEIWVAVIDCGVQINHPDLKEKILTKYSVDITNNNKKLMDCPNKPSKYGQYTGPHGTMVAGLIAAKANNGKYGAGVTSIAGDINGREVCKIMAIKCGNELGPKNRITKSYLARAVNYAVFHGAEVINISYSAKKSQFKPSDFKNLQNAIRRAQAADVCVIASAGNDGSKQLHYPAAFRGVIGVGATLPDDTMAPYSNQSSAVDIVAPGGNGTKKIFSIRPVRKKRKRGYGYGKGSSYSAPQVAGTVAMMKSINYDLTPKQILEQLKKSSTKTVKGTLDTGKSFPLLNAGRAVSMTK